MAIDIYQTNPASPEKPENQATAVFPEAAPMAEPLRTLISPIAVGPELVPTEIPLSQLPRKNKWRWLVRLFWMVATGLFVISIIYLANEFKDQLGFEWGKPGKDRLSAPVQLAVGNPEPAAEATMPAITDVNKDWKYLTNKECGLQMPLPLKKVDKEGRFWQYEESKGLLIGFKVTSTVIYRSVDDPEGFIAAAVQVQCGENNGGNEDDYAIKLNETLGAIKGPQAIRIDSAMGEQLWGRKVKVMTFKGGLYNPAIKYYLLTSSKNVYLASKIVMTDDPELAAAAEAVWENLKFE
jgi:hypothetical protein